MTLDQLERIVAIAHEKSFRRAAELLCVESPTLSASVKNLEAELGVTLFDRKGNTGVFVTPMGERIVAQAKCALAQAAALKQMAAKFRKGVPA